MSESLHPSEGIRVRLCRTSESAAFADYTAEIFTPVAHFEYRALLKSDGGIDLVPTAVPATAEDEKQLKNIAASVARAAGRNVEQGLPPWPARIVRWRVKRS